MGKLADSDGRFERERFRIQGPDFVIGFVADVELARDRMNGDACQKNVGALPVRLDGPFGRRFAIGVFVNVHKPGSAARNKEPTAFLAEGQTIPGLGQRQELSHLPIRHIEQCHPMIAEPAADCNQAALVRRDDQLERHVTDGHLIACGRDAPAIEQQVFIRLQSLFPADCGAVDVLKGLADRIRIGG